LAQEEADVIVPSTIRRDSAKIGDAETSNMKVDVSGAIVGSE
jgi:hypothetical protein